MKTELTENDRLEIANSPLTIKDLVKKYDTSYHTVSKIKREAGTSLGRGNNINRTAGYKITKAQKQEIIGSDLSAKELSAKYDLHITRINKIKRDAGVSRGRGHKNNMVVLSDYHMERIKDVTISTRKLSEEIGLTLFMINARRRDLGIVFKPSKQKREYNPRVKKVVIPRVKIERIKVVKEPILNQSTKNLNKQKKTAFEEQNEAMSKAIKAKEKFQTIEDQRKKDGWRWESVVDEYGKKSMIFRKPLHLSVFK